MNLEPKQVPHSTTAQKNQVLDIIIGVDIKWLGICSALCDSVNKLKKCQKATFIAKLHHGTLHVKCRETLRSPGKVEIMLQSDYCSKSKL